MRLPDRAGRAAPRVLRPGAALLLAVASAATPARADPIRGLTAAEISAHIRAPGPVRQLVVGIFPERPALALDGAHLAFARGADDIHDAQLIVLDADGGGRRVFAEPYGWKHAPILLGGDYDDGFASKHRRQLLARLEPKGRKPGIYILDLEAKRPAFVPWLLGPYLEMALAPGGRRLVAVKASLGEPGPAHYQGRPPSDELWLFELGEGRPPVAGARLAVDIQGSIRGPAFAADGETIYFSAWVERAGAEELMLYAAPARPQSTARDLVPGGVDVSANWFGSRPRGGPGDVIAFARLLVRDVGGMRLPTGQVHSYGLTTAVSDVLIDCTAPVICGNPLFSPADARLFFTAQIGTEAGGLFVVTR